MKTTTLGSLKKGQSFYFGQIEFKVYHNNGKDDLIPCCIAGTDKTVYISTCALVEVQEVKNSAILS